MSETDERIARFTRMAEADPTNELAHFSLGAALVDAKRYAEATDALRRAIEINPELSKAYQLLAQSQLEQGDREGALDTLRRGESVAQRRGDVMPAKSMAQMLRRLGEPVAGGGEHDVPVRRASTTGFACRRCGGGEKMDRAPMRGPLGEQVHASVCADCWQEWLAMGTKVINELRLDFREPRAHEAFERYMAEFLGL